MSDTIKYNSADNGTITFNTEQLFNVETANFKCSGFGLGPMSRAILEPVVLEIGCDIGDTSDYLLNGHPMLKLYSIDPYENYVDWNGNALNEREEIYQRMMKRMERYGDRFTLIRDFSDNVVNEFMNEEFDIIFIDGLHTYDQLTKDCANYYSKLKPGGIFAGHDYNAITGVRKAADEFAAKVGKEILFTESDVWYWVK